MRRLLAMVMLGSMMPTMAYAVVSEMVLRSTVPPMTYPLDALRHDIQTGGSVATYLWEIDEIRQALKGRRASDPSAKLTASEQSALAGIQDRAAAEFGDDIMAGMDVILSVISIGMENSIDPRMKTPENFRKVEEKLTPLVALYIIGEHCAENDVAFTADEVIVMKKTISMMVDTLEIDPQRMDQIWGASSTTFRTMRDQTTVDDCVGSRQAAGAAFPFPRTAGANPFSRR